MKPSQREDLVELIAEFAEDGEGLVSSAIPGVFFFRATATNTPVPAVYNPSLCIVAQGAKEVLLGKELYQYGPAEYLIASVDLPVMGRVTQATKNKPYLALKIDIDINQLSELLIYFDKQEVINKKAERGLFVGKTDAVLDDVVLRLMHLLQSPEDIPVLSTQILREIYYRLLCGDYGKTILQILMKGTSMHRIAAAIQKIKQDFHLPISIDSLSALAGMSESTFYAHFKSVTTMSPLQFQKSIRLMEARNLMLTQNLDAASSAYRVGYESPSQFSREYARFFGNPPLRDKAQIIQKHH